MLNKKRRVAPNGVALNRVAIFKASGSRYFWRHRIRPRIFDEIIAPFLGDANAKQMLLNFARSQARLDPRVGNEYTFENFSLVIGKGQNPAQAPRFDWVLPNFQFGLMLAQNRKERTFCRIP
jgi:hypothetical protein